MENKKWLHQDEIRKLEDKKLQLQYILGGLNREEYKACQYNDFWGCDIRCSCPPVDDDERLFKIQKFIDNHNISNSTFLRLIKTYLTGGFNPYSGDFGLLIPELDRSILDYKFSSSSLNSFTNTDLKERELLDLIGVSISSISKTPLKIFLEKYNLKEIDFLILAKTSLNYKYNVGRGFEKTDLPLDLTNILKSNNLYQSPEFVKKYREEYQRRINKKNKPLIKILFK